MDEGMEIPPEFLSSSFFERRNEPTTDRTREIDFVNKLKPFKFDVKGEYAKLIEGDVPMEALVEYYGLLSPVVSLSNITSLEDEMILTAMQNIISIDIRMSHPRMWFDAVKNANEDHIALLFRLRMMMSRNNQERKNTITQGYIEKRDMYMDSSGRREATAQTSIYQKLRSFL